MVTIIRSVKLLLLLIFLSTAFSVAYAKEEKLITDQELNSMGFTKYESINPDSLFYPLKRVGEKVRSFFILNKEGKEGYSFKLLDTRFNELVYIINIQKTGFLDEVVNRYNSTIGDIKSNFNPTKNKDQLIKYAKMLGILRDQYSSNSAYWLYIQQAVDTTNSVL